MRVHAFRLHPKEDLKLGIEEFAGKTDIRAGFIVSCVGSLSEAALRMAGASAEQQDIRYYIGRFEIVSLVGTLAMSGSHLHMAISDEDGDLIGGHLKEGSFVHTTAEIVIGEAEDLDFGRTLDPATGFPELSVIKHTK